MLVPTSISIYFSDDKALVTGTSDDSAVFVFTSNCMDYQRRSPDYSGQQRLHPQYSNPTLRRSPSPSGRTPAPYSSPLPQTQWAEVPLPYRPRDWPESDDELYESVHNSPAPAWYLRPPEAPSEIQTAEVGSEARRRRRPRGIRDIFTRSQIEAQAQAQPGNVSMLYPQLSPYDARMSTYSAPEDLERHHVRSMVEAESPGYPPAFSRNLEPPEMGIPRSPTYPPASRRRGHSSAGGDDHGFTDEEEFHLFVQATAGLGPDTAFRHPHPFSPTETTRWREENHIPVLNRPATTGDIVSPLGETPSTMYAYQQLPQMPERHQHSLPRRERFETSTPGLDLWLNNPPAAVTELEEISPIEEFDDELPDYAQSQAQAQAHQRAEAARRAQELQRRWQMSGSRRGI